MGSNDDVAVASRGHELARLRGLLGAGGSGDVVRALGKWTPAERAASPEALTLLADAQLAAGAADRAVDTARELVLAARGEDGAALAGAVLAASLAGRPDGPSLAEARQTLDPLVAAVRGRLDGLAARVHLADGVVHLREDRLDEARLALLDAVAAAAACGDDRLCACAHDTLAIVHTRLGDTQRALVHHDQVLRLRTALGDVAACATTHRVRGGIFLREGRPDAALAEFDACVELSHHVRDALGLSLTLAARGTALTALERFDEADAALRAALRIADSAGHAAQAAACTRDLAVLADRRGLRDDAIALATSAAAKFEAAGDKAGAGGALIDLGRIRVKAGDAAAARALFERAVGLLRSTPRAELLADALLRLAEVSPDHADSPGYLDEAERLGRAHLLRGVVRDVQAARERLPLGSPGSRVHGARNYVAFGRDRREYHFVERIGKGGESETWKASDAATGRPVVVRLQPIADRTDDDRVAFEAALGEFERALRLDHRGVIRIHDFERVGRELFVAMDLIAGPDLRAHPRGGPPDAHDAWTWIAEIASALDALHWAGILHRDLQPENVVFDAAGRPVIVDLGFALVANRRGPLAGRFAGAPGYAAPEQWTGAPVDARADLFAFGAIAIELLSGRNFLTDGARLRSSAEHVALMKDPRRVAALIDAVPWPDHVWPEARSSLRRLVDPDPAGRPASAGAALAACAAR